MFFKTSRAMFKDIRSEIRSKGPAKEFAFRVYCLIVFAAFLFNFYVFSLGFPEVLSWFLWFAGIFPVLFLVAFWEMNIPAEAVSFKDLWPKVWFFRGRQIWPRQQ